MSIGPLKDTPMFQNTARQSSDIADSVPTPRIFQPNIVSGSA